MQRHSTTYRRVIWAMILAGMVPVRAASISSNGTGGGNWAAPSTWAGGVVPGNGDTVTIADGDTVAIPAATAVTVGTSPANDTSTPAIQCASGPGTGILNIAGWLTFRGTVKQCNATWTISAGATITHDSSQAATPSSTHYTWQIGLQNGSGASILAVNGTSASHVTIGIAAGSGYAGGFTGFSSAGQDTGLIQGSYADIDSWGQGGFASRFSLHSVSGVYSIDHFKITNSGDIEFNELNGQSSVSITNCSITSPVLASGYAINMTGLPPIIGNLGLRRISGNFIQDGAVRFSSSNTIAGIDLGMQFQNNVIYLDGSGATVAISTGNYPMFSGQNWSNNLVLTLLPNGNFAQSAVLPGGSIVNTYFAFGGSTCNSLVNYHATGTVGAIDQLIQGDIFEPDCGGNGGPDAIQVKTVSAGNHVWYVKVSQNIFLSGAQDGNGYALVNNSSTTACDNSTIYCAAITVQRNTFVGPKSATGDGGYFKLEGNSSTNHEIAGLFTAVWDNLGYQVSTGAGQITGSTTSNITWVTGTYNQVDYNWLYNFSSSPLYAQNATSDGYTNPSTPGTHDTVGSDPQFVDASRRLLSWCQSIDNTITTWGGCAAKFDQNGTSYDSRFTVAALLSWVRAGFLPQNAATRTAAHDGLWVGALLPTPYGTPATLQGLSQSAASLQPYTYPSIPAASSYYADAYHLDSGTPINMWRVPDMPATCDMINWNSGGVYPPTQPVYYATDGNYYYVDHAAGVQSTAGVPPETGGVVNSPWVLTTQAAACAMKNQEPEYSQRPAFNKDDTLFYTITGGSGGSDFAVYNNTSPPTLAYVVSNAQVSANTSDTTWSHSDPHVMYIANSVVQPPQFQSIDVTTGAVTTIHTFDVTGGECPAGTHYVRNGGSGNPSTDDRYWFEFCLDASNTYLGVLVYDKQADAVVSKSTVTSLCGSNVAIDWGGMSPSGKWVDIAWAVSGYEDTWHTCQGDEEFTWQTGSFVSQGMLMATDGHNDIGYDVNGFEVLVEPYGTRYTGGPNQDNWMVMVTRFADVHPPPYSSSGHYIGSYVKRYLVPCSWYSSQVGTDPYVGCTGTSTSGTNGGIESWHLSGRGTETTTPGWFMLSSFGTGTNPATEFPGWGRNENVALQIDSTLPTLSDINFRRVSRNISSRAGGNTTQCPQGIDYWQEPHASVSRDWTNVLFASAWLNQCGRVYGIVTPLTGGGGVSYIPPPHHLDVVVR